MQLEEISRDWSGLKAVSRVIIEMGKSNRKYDGMLSKPINKVPRENTLKAIFEIFIISRFSY